MDLSKEINTIRGDFESIILGSQPVEEKARLCSLRAAHVMVSRERELLSRIKKYIDSPLINTVLHVENTRITSDENTLNSTEYGATA